MRKTSFFIIISCLLVAGVFYGVEESALLASHYWISGALIVLGMALLVSQLAVNREWGVSGLAGIVCLGDVLASSVISGTADWSGIALLTAGVGLLLIEARVLPGHGVSAFAGLVAIFFGVYSVFAVTAGMVFAIALAAIVSAMSFIALLAYLPKSAAWREMSMKIPVSMGRVSTSAIAGNAQVSNKAVGHVAVRTVTKSQDKVAEESAAYSAAPRKSGRAMSGAQILENMRKRLQDLQASAVPIVAEQLSLERALSAARARMAQLDASARQAVSQGRDDLARDLLMQKDACQARVDDLSFRLGAAAEKANAARQRIDEFNLELKTTERRASDAQVREQLGALTAEIRSQIEEGTQVIEHFEEAADAACAEADIYQSHTVSDKASELAERKRRAARALADLKMELRRNPQSSHQNRQSIRRDRKD